MGVKDKDTATHLPLMTSELYFGPEGKAFIPLPMHDIEGSGRGLLVPVWTHETGLMLRVDMQVPFGKSSLLALEGLTSPQGKCYNLASDG